MRRSDILHFIFHIVFISAAIIPFSADAQTHGHAVNQIAVTGWADDTHYLYRSFDKNKNLVTVRVDVKTSKSTTFTPEVSGRDLIATLLPVGTTLTMNDVLSPDSKSIILIKDNDLFLFTSADKAIKKTHKR